MKLRLNSPLDMHLHLRQGEVLHQVIESSAGPFAAAVIMPNLLEPVDSLTRLEAYRTEILSAAGPRQFTPLMTLFFRSYTRTELVSWAPRLFGIKLYPAGVTTNSDSGLKTIEAAADTFEQMQELGLPLLVHGESSGYVLDREREFLRTYRWLAESFPGLHIVMEHITTAAALELLERYDNLSATLTLHHLMLTLDDLLGGLLRPHLFCKPVAKSPRDRQALREAVLSAHPKIMFGSDSAPHPRHHKESCGCAAGIFSAPVALPALAQFFERHDKLELLQGFVSTIACRRYRYRPQQKTVVLEKKTFDIPKIYGTIIPYLAGETLDWMITEIIDSDQTIGVPG